MNSRCYRENVLTNQSGEFSSTAVEHAVLNKLEYNVMNGPMGIYTGV